MIDLPNDQFWLTLLSVPTTRCVCVRAVWSTETRSDRLRHESGRSLASVPLSCLRSGSVSSDKVSPLRQIFPASGKRGSNRKLNLNSKDIQKWKGEENISHIIKMKISFFWANKLLLGLSGRFFVDIKHL